MMCSVVGAVALLSATVNRHEPTPLKLVYPGYFGNRITVPDDNPTTEEGVRLGRMLFYETAMSSSHKVSCATCHKQELAFTDGLRFSAGHDGTPQVRNTMSLANLLWVRRLFWDGRANSLEDQALIPLTQAHEMGQAMDVSVKNLQALPAYRRLFTAAFGSDNITEKAVVKALAQFERTLISADSKYDRYLQGKYSPTASEKAGMALFFANPDPAKGVRGAGCGHCHGGPKTFVELFHNNGLDSIAADKGRQPITGQPFDEGRFRVPTLRNIALTAPYMHDGRFATLEEVVDHYNSGLKSSAMLSVFLKEASNEAGGKSLRLTVQERADVVAFLRMLTDSTFITNPLFSDPFTKSR